MAIDTIITKFLTRGEDNLRSTLQGLSGDISTFEGKQARLNLASNAMIAGGAGVVGVLGLVGAASLKSAGDIERVEAGLTSMLGSSDAAKKKLSELQQFAKETPFDFGDTAAAAQQLLAMGISADKLIPTLKGVGNAVAAGGGGTEQFKGVLLALGQIQTKGKLSAEELMQMAERGIPVFDILQKKLGLTKDQVANIGNSGIDSKAGIDALVQGMSEVGGGTGLEEMSNTLPGKLSNLGDSANQAAGAVGKLFSQDAKDFIGTVSGALDKMRDFIEANPAMAKAIIGTVAAGGVSAVVAGGIGKLAGIYNEVTHAKERLLGATKADDLAEAAKAVTAGKEGDAIGGVGDEANKTTQKLGVLARAKAFLATPLSIGGNALTKVEAFGGGGGAVTAGTAAVAGVEGLVGAMLERGAMKDAGYSDGVANVTAGVTGLLEAGVAAFVPGGPIIVAALEGFQSLIGHIQDNQDKAAEAGSGLSDEEANKQKGMTHAQKQKQYEDLWHKLVKEGAPIEDIAGASAAAKAEQRMAREEADPNSKANMAKGDAELRASSEAFARASGASIYGPSEKDAKDKALWGDNAPEVGKVTVGRNGSRRVIFVAELPPSPGDVSERNNQYRRNTAAPDYSRAY